MQVFRDAIRENNLHLLTGIIESANHVGMHSFDQYLQELLAAGVILEDGPEPIPSTDNAWIWRFGDCYVAGDS